MNSNLPEFKSISSIPAIKRNFIVKCIVLVMALAFFGILVLSVYWLLFFELSLLYVFLILLSGVICFVVVRQFLYHYPIHISFLVDETGLHKITTGKKNETKSILYKDLVNPKGGIKPKDTTYGLLLTRSRNPNFVIYSIDKSNKIICTADNFTGDIATNGVYRNHKKLVGTFLLGVSTFRPDIEIDPSLFAYYFIDTQTFEHNAKEQTKRYVQVVVFVVFVISVILYFTLNS